MRDLLLVGFLFVAIYFSFKKPFLGVAAWVWIALTAPADWVFGFSQSFRLNLTIVVVTATAYLVNKSKVHAVQKGGAGAIKFWVLFFLFWTLISTVFHNQINDSLVWSKFIEFTKVIVLFVFITIAVTTRTQINTIVWAIVLSISSFAAMESIKFALSGGGHHIVGKAGIIADRNDLAVAINMCIPFIFYLWSESKNKALRIGLIVLVALNALAIIGTYSRGGFIGLSILAFAMWLRSDRKMRYLIFALFVLPILYAKAPDEWRDRQSTVETAAVEDSSFIGRLWAWKIATMISLDDPFTGGGMKATTDPLLWGTYAPYTENFGFIYTPPIAAEHRPLAAHNIYFQVLGGSGFVGLGIFLIMLMVGLLKCLSNASVARREGVVWAKNLSDALTLSFVGYGITGMNVSLAYFELLYAVLGIICVVTVVLNQELQKNQSPNLLLSRR